MQMLVLGGLLLGILAFLSPRISRRVRVAFEAAPARVLAIPFLLTAIFAAASSWAGAFSVPLAGAVLVYFSVPAVLAFVQGQGQVKRGSWLDFAVFLSLWLPMEFAAGAALVPRPAQGFLHSVAYGLAILLALTIFLGFRPLEGMRYRLPAGRDLALGFAGFAVTAPVLIVVGIWIGFIPWFHASAQSPGRMIGTFLAIAAGTALPEELLFRSLVQNWIAQRLGENWKTLLIAGVIFGSAHLDNGPQPLPNWRYAILATIAGVAYGRVFQKSRSIFSSALFHTLVDTTKHFFF